MKPLTDGEGIASLAADLHSVGRQVGLYPALLPDGAPRAPRRAGAPYGI
jgi:hypothetical protein